MKCKKASRGFLLSLDALVAIGLILMLVIFLGGFIFTYSSPELRYQRLYYTSKDLLNVIGEVKIKDLQDFQIVQDYITQGIFIEDDMNKTLLDVVGSFWATGNATYVEYARNLTRDIFNETLPQKIGYELLIDNSSIYRKDISSNVGYLARLSTVVSGYEIGKPVAGYMSKAYITTVGKIASSFAYFGGYVGDGNMTRIVALPNDAVVKSAYMELDVGNNFTLYINGNQSGNYIKGSAGGGNMTADKWDISSYISNFAAGNNTITINFSINESDYVGGGYIKVTYNTTQFVTEGNLTRYWFPGIDGTINLYDSFYVPGDLNGMDLFANFSTNTSLFINIGNITVYEGNSSPVIISNSTLYLILDYNALSQNTIPLRIGHFALNATNATGNVTDTILTTSRVNAMNTVDIPNGSGNISRIAAARELDKIFVDIILNRTGNRVGLVSYKADVPASRGCNGWKEPLTDNETKLKCQINNYDARPGQRCLCCAIRESINLIISGSNPLKKRIIVLMSDGDAEKTTPSNCPDDPPFYYTGDPNQDSVNQACAAFQNHGTKVYSIGFGVDANNTLLQEIAACGGGRWMSSTNYTGLEEIYREIAEEIANESVVYEYQKIIATNVTSTLYPDSYIEFNYSAIVNPFEYGELSLTFESKRLRSSTGNNLTTPDPLGLMNGTKLGWYFIPEDTEVVDAKITSYSSDYWTDRLWINSTVTPNQNWTRVYWLGNYSDNYLPLGDPYIVHIPANLVGIGNNSVRIGTGNDPDNATGGSPDDRVIYTLRIKGIALEGYSSVFPRAGGSNVTVYYDIDGDNSPDGSINIAVGPDPTDIFDPQNDSIDDAFMRLLDNLNFILDVNPNSGDYGNGSVGNEYDGVNQSNPIDLQITTQVNFDSSSVGSVPSLWGPARLEIRIWV